MTVGEINSTMRGPAGVSNHGGCSWQVSGFIELVEAAGYSKRAAVTETGKSLAVITPVTQAPQAG